jgi:large conductance mechanosensitive channel
VVIGAAFGTIVSSLVKDIIMPPIGKLLGGVDFTNLFVTSGRGHVSHAQGGPGRGAATLNYGLFFNAVINFVIIAFALFLVVKAMNNMKRQEATAPPPPTRQALPAVPDGDPDQGREVRALY